MNDNAHGVLPRSKTITLWHKAILQKVSKQLEHKYKKHIDDITADRSIKVINCNLMSGSVHELTSYSANDLTTLSSGQKFKLRDVP